MGQIVVGLVAMTLTVGVDALFKVPDGLLGLALGDAPLADGEVSAAGLVVVILHDCLEHGVRYC